MTGHRPGFDLVAVTEVREAVLAHGDAYLNRVYTVRELDECAGDPRKLAACFAAKEATIKALCRDDKGFGWDSIGLIGGPDEQLAIELTGEAEGCARNLGLAAVAVSITHQHDHAAAIVLMEETNECDDH